MNREIKFRGKDANTGEWRHGDFYRIPAPPQCMGEPEPPKCYIVFENPRTLADWGMPRQMVQSDVIPSTVGQYTGEKDKNGKDVYEGDMVQTYICGEKYHACQIKYVDRMFCMAGEFDSEFEGQWYYEFEIIGNIHDNPELKGETV
jgi:hypothetical protein